MKRTSMFLCCFALLASIICEVAWAQCPGGNCAAANYSYGWGWFPWYTYQYPAYQKSKTCNSPACARMQALSETPATVPATVDEAEPVPAEEQKEEPSEAVPAVIEEPKGEQSGNPSLETTELPAEEAVEETVVADTAEPEDNAPAAAEEEQSNTVELPLCPFAARVIALINWHRAQAGLPPLKADINLVNGCQNHSRWMLSYGFQHAAGGGRECIAMGVNTPESLVNLWMNSSGHRAIIMGWGTWIGIGSAGTYHTLRIR